MKELWEVWRDGDRKRRELEKKRVNKRQQGKDEIKRRDGRGIKAGQADAMKQLTPRFIWQGG